LNATARNTIKIGDRVQQHSAKLLARLLREHWARRHGVQPTQEARDE
jgi:hypothetical protein